MEKVSRIVPALARSRSQPKSSIVSSLVNIRKKKGNMSRQARRGQPGAQGKSHSHSNSSRALFPVQLVLAQLRRFRVDDAVKWVECNGRLAVPGDRIYRQMQQGRAA